MLTWRVVRVHPTVEMIVCARGMTSDHSAGGKARSERLVYELITLQASCQISHLTHFPSAHKPFMLFHTRQHL